jgi:hypothetical protein
MLNSLTLQIKFTYTKYNLSCSFKSDIFNCLKRQTDLLLLPALNSWHIQRSIFLCAAAFARLVHLTNFYHLCILATLWKHTGHFSISRRLSVNVTQLKEIISVTRKAKLLVLTPRLKNRSLAPLATAYPSMNICQIHNSWEIWQWFS